MSQTPPDKSTPRTDQTDPSAPSKAKEATPAPIGRIDQIMQSHPWHPRVAPWLAYMILMTVTITAKSMIGPAAYLPAYLVQIAGTGWLLWRIRSHLPEMNWKFHWWAIVFGAGVFVIWVALGRLMAEVWFPQKFGDVGADDFRDPDQMGPIVGWAALIARLVGMSVIVPMIEEVFNRSLLLRSLHSAKMTGRGVVQLGCDFPVVGDWLLNTQIGQRLSKEPPVFGPQFQATPLGKLSVFSVVVSSLIFTSVHHLRDYPACFICGVAYCLCVWLTNRGKLKLGLGPVIWAHAITNAMLWAYTLTTDDWRFL